MSMIYTGNTLSFQAAGKFHQIHKSHPNFVEIVNLVKTGDYEQAAKLIDIRSTISSALVGSKAELRGNQVYYNGEPIHSVLAKRILDMSREGFPVASLLLFLENLMQNPSKRAVDELYGFLEASGLPITDDGHFLAYKSVRSDFKDHHTGTMDNSVGAIVEMPRNKVDEDKDRTCSSGLHFAAHEYAKNFGSSGRMVVLKINPKDVVAIPSDYNNQKGRACRYEVVEEVQRGDTKLVNKPFVSTKTTTVTFDAAKSVATPTLGIGSRVVLTAQGAKKWGGDHASQGAGGLGTITSKCSTPGFTWTVLWDNKRKNWYCEGDLELAPAAPVYTPESDNYKDATRWDAVQLGITTFIGKASQFPVNRDVPYLLERRVPSKVYRGEFYFVNYDVPNDNLVFARHKPDGTVDRYVTIKDVKEWFIQVDFDTLDN